MKYSDGKPGPGLGQAQKCGVKPVKVIPNPYFLYAFLNTFLHLSPQTH
jgi:hypothetical protein